MINTEIRDEAASQAEGEVAPLSAPDSAPSEDPPLQPGVLPVEQVGAEICRLAGQIAAATSRFLRLLADFDARQGWAGWNISSCAHWLSWRCGLDLRTAREHVRVARALTELPLIRDSFDAGRISYSKVRAIARVATTTSEADLLDAALHAPAAHLERLTRGLRSAQKHSPTPDDLGMKPLPKPRPGKQISSYWDDDSGDLIISGRLSPADGARLLAAATRTTLELTRTDPEPNDDAPTVDRQSAPEPALTTRPPSDLGPALLAMADMVCAHLPAPTQAPAADVLVTVDVHTLVEAFSQTPTEENHPSPPDTDPDHLDEPDEPRPGTPGTPSRGARLDDGPALTAACLRRLVDDGRLRFAVTAPDGHTLELGRASRTPNASQFRALWRRDRGCTVPGCGRTRFLHAHHVVFWSNGGATTLDNLVLLCSAHHRALHDGRFTITALGGQQFRFHGPDGAIFAPAPPIRGNADDLTTEYRTITPDTIQLNWDGAPLHSDAVATCVAAWTQAA